MIFNYFRSKRPKDAIVALISRGKSPLNKFWRKKVYDYSLIEWFQNR
jgi:hypothetical protein